MADRLGGRVGDLPVLQGEILADMSTLTGSLHGWNDHLPGMGDAGSQGGGDCACWHSASGHGGFGSLWGFGAAGSIVVVIPRDAPQPGLSLCDVPGRQLGVTALGCLAP